MFDIVGVAASLEAPALGGLEAVRPGSSLRDDGPGAAEALPVLTALRPVVPGGGLRRGSAVGIEGAAGAGSLGAALVAGVSAHGGWCAAVGLPEFGVLAAAGMGAEPERLLLVDEPGDRWPDAVAALVEAVDLVLLRPPERAAVPVVRRLAALARRHGGVLAVTGPAAPAWPGVRTRLRVEEAAWTGLGDGHGHLRGRRALVSAAGQGSPRRAWIWLPGPDGKVAEAAPAESAGDPTRPALEVVA